MTRYVVATVEEIPPGERKIVTVARRSVGVFNVDGEFYAIRNQCPHQGGPLCSGVVSGFAASPSPGQYTYLRRGEILRCPWHGWEFDIRTGQSWFDPARTRVRAYRTTVEGREGLADAEFADAGPADGELAEAGLAEGPYTAQMYRVEVDRPYVVVHI